MGKKAEKKKEQRGQQDVAKAAKKADAPPTVEEAPRGDIHICLLYTSPSPRDGLLSRMPSSA